MGNSLKIISKSKKFYFLFKFEIKQDSIDECFYNNVKYVWTDLDVRKWKTAVENNLNFIVIYPYGDEDIVYAHWKQCEDNKFVLEQINELF